MSKVRLLAETPPGVIVTVPGVEALLNVASPALVGHVRSPIPSSQFDEVVSQIPFALELVQVNWVWAWDETLANSEARIADRRILSFMVV